MLVDPTIVTDDMLTCLLSHMGREEQKRLAKGIYLWWSFGNYLNLRRFEYEYPSLPFDLACFGVCDSIEQFLERYKEKLESSENNYTVSFSHIKKEPANKGQFDGWRWHKWGPYIGDGKPMCEYLDDEDGFDDGVYIYHVYQIPDHHVATRISARGEE